jgi:hypothetical protein
MEANEDVHGDPTEAKGNDSDTPNMSNSGNNSADNSNKSADNGNKSADESNFGRNGPVPSMGQIWRTLALQLR